MAARPLPDESFCNVRIWAEGSPTTGGIKDYTLKLQRSPEPGNQGANAAQFGASWQPTPDNLFMRWTQFGALSPVMQMHRQIATNHQYPWSYGATALDNYRAYAKVSNEQSERLLTIRGMFRLKTAEEDGRTPVPLDEVEPAKTIVRRFATATKPQKLIPAIKKLLRVRSSS